MMARAAPEGGRRVVSASERELSRYDRASTRKFIVGPRKRLKLSIDLRNSEIGKTFEQLLTPIDTCSADAPLKVELGVEMYRRDGSSALDEPRCYRGMKPNKSGSRSIHWKKQRRQ